MRRLLVLSIAALCAGTATAADDAAGWLLKASEASRHVAYRGVVVYRDADRMETLRVVHRNQDGREQERLTALSGAPRDVVRDNGYLRCLSDHDHAGEVTEAPQDLLPALSAETLRKAAPHYAVRNLGEARVAGRTARGVAIAPRDEFRYGFEVWADGATAVPLKVSMVDRRGQTVEQMLYTEVEFPRSIPDRAFAVGGLPGLPIRRADPAPAGTVHKTVAAASAPTGWSMGTLPAGFAMALRTVTPDTVEHVLLSDGLSAVSIFAARPADSGALFRGFSHMGAMNAYGRVVGAYHLTVVGEVPQATVRLIGDGLQSSDTK